MFLLPVMVYAQSEANKMETLFDGQEFKSGGYGALEMKGVQLNGEWGFMLGGRGGWIINSMFSIGGGGYGLTSTHRTTYKEPSDTGKDTYLRLGYGGVFLEYTNSSSSLAHFTANTLIGWGSAAYSGELDEIFKDGDRKKSSNWIYRSSNFFVVEPGVTAELNIAKSFRIALGASYRLVSGLDLPVTKNSDLSGLSVNMAFKIGHF